jgi:hypothetical protein
MEIDRLIRFYVLTDFFTRLQKELSKSDATVLALDQFLSRESDDLTTLWTIWKEKVGWDRGLAGRVVKGMEIVLKVKLEKAVEAEILKLKAIAEQAASRSQHSQYQKISDTELHPDPSITPIQPDLLPLPPSRAPLRPLLRVKSPQQNPLTLLCCIKGKRSSPKLENFRTKLVRGMMRSLREFKKGKCDYPGSGTHAIDEEEGEQVETYETLKSYFLENQEELESCGSTSNAPETNKNRRKSKPRSTSTTHLSYNQAFCQAFLTPQASFRYFRLYVDVVFGGTNCEQKCRRLEARCCAEMTHNESCVEVWEQVGRYAKEGMLRDLGLI